MSIRRPLTVVAAIALGLTAIGIAAPAQAAPKGGTTLTVFEKRTSRDVIDLPPNGNTVGDLVVGSGTITKTRGGATIGSFAYSAQTVKVEMPGGPENRLATIWVNLPGGSLEASSLISVPQGTQPSTSNECIIVGGTGKYAGAKGTMTLTPLSSDEYKLVYRFTS